MNLLLKATPWLFLVVTVVLLFGGVAVWIFGDLDQAILTTTNNLCWIYTGLATFVCGYVLLTTLIQLAIIDIMPDLKRRENEERERMLRLSTIMIQLYAPVMGIWIINRIGSNYVHYRQFDGTVVLGLVVALLFIILPWFYYQAYLKKRLQPI